MPATPAIKPAHGAAAIGYDPRKAATRADVMKVCDIINEVTALLAERIRKVEARLDALAAERVATLADAFRGSWQSPLKYARGSLVVDDGSTWLCMADSIGVRPGTDQTWKLLVKSGRDTKGGSK